MNPATDTKAQLAATLQVLGSDVVYYVQDDEANPRTIRALVQMVNPRDDAIVNAYGLQAMYVDVAVDALPAMPRKYDSVDIAGRRMVVEVVHDVLVSGVVCGYHMTVRGR